MVTVLQATACATEGKEEATLAHTIDSAMHAVQVRRMTHCCHCYAIDHRGMGDSQLQLPTGLGESLLRSEQEIHQASAALPTLEGFAEDIRAVINHLGCNGKSHSRRPAPILVLQNSREYQPR